MTTKAPRLLLEEPTTGAQIFAFPPNRETLGGTAYLLRETQTILIDCPAWHATNQNFLAAQGVDWLFLTHRGAIAQVKEIQQTLNCRVLIQEQEAYLLPGLTLTTFLQDYALTPHSRALWTPGHSPGSACLYYSGWGGVLFSGRHLLPDPQGQLMPLRTAKTFHWRRQLRSTHRLLHQFSATTLQHVCPGANQGFLRNRGTVREPWSALQRWQAANPEN